MTPNEIVVVVFYGVLGVMFIGSMIAWYRAVGRECSLRKDLDYCKRILMNYTQTPDDKGSSTNHLQYNAHDDSDGGDIGSITVNIDQKPINQKTSHAEEDNGN